MIIFPDNQAEENFDNIRREIMKTNVGSDLIDRIEQSDHTCRVEFVNDALVRADGGASAALENPASDKIPGKAILNLFAPAEVCRAYPDVDHESKDELEAYWKSYKNNNGNMNLPLINAIEQADMNERDIIEKVNWPANNVPFDEEALERLIYAEPDLVAGYGKLWREHLWRLIWLLRPYLEFGEGAKTRIKIGESIGQYYASPLPDLVWQYCGWIQFPDSHVIVVHEFIHALRIMEGRRVVDRGWEEEAMTVGLDPLANEEFSENKYRRACGLAAAPSHNDPVYSCQSAKFAQLGGGDPKKIFAQPR